MYTVKVESDFSSAHNLRGYKGKCEELHGHNWKVEVSVASDRLDAIGMVIDFGELKNALNEVLSGLDHKHLNSLEYFKSVNPTSENIAKYVFERIAEKKQDLHIRKVTVWETPKACASYSVT
ncbi:MAG: 6-carboxytetrahydropterin synthase QueD [Candidatus Omnitrophota bacterium]